MRQVNFQCQVSKWRLRIYLMNGVQMAKANGVRWYDGHVLRRVVEFEVKGKRKRGQPKKT